MRLIDFFALLCSLIAGLSAMTVAFHPNILHAAIALIFSLFAVAGLYGALGSQFLAAAQVMIYVGGVLVVILFAIMMSADLYRNRLLRELKRVFVPSLLALVALIALVRLVFVTPWPRGPDPGATPTTVEQMGEALVGPYALPLELSALLLLSGLVGAVVVARPRGRNESGETDA
jgi:NADH:ubiquinone oxidoreductase subunit 6 (subunit J)